MSLHEVSDRQLLQLIHGELSESDERHLENLLSLDGELQARLEKLSGCDQWSPGSAPVPLAHESAQLSLAMERVSQFITTGGSEAGLGLSGAAEATPYELPKLPTLTGITLVRQIGQGGMGVVYEGLDDALGRRVAVKFIQPMRAASPEAQERLIREAKATAALHHDNIVTIHSIQSIDGTPALVQQFVDGPTLQEVLDSEGALPIDRCVDLAKQLAKGLAAAHRAGIIHRDLKPGNVLIDKQAGIARLADFGMAKHLAELHLSSPDVVSGTPAYMSPEQTRGEPTDGRSDLFSLGSILFAAIAGQPPFRGDDPFIVMDQVRSAPPPALTKLRPDSPAWLNAIVEKLLAKTPDDRIASAEELLQLLEPSTKPRSNVTSMRSVALVSLCVLALGVCTFVWWPRAKSQPSATPKAATETSPMIWIGDPARSFATLQQAVKDATDGDVITIASDLTIEQIDVVGKRLTICAAPGRRPVIRPTEWAMEHSPFCIRADRDLTVRGLHIDWPVHSEPLSEPGATLSAALAVTQATSTLRVEDCTLHRDQGICLAAMGNLQVDRSRISGGKFALGWVANNSHATITDSTLDCETAWWSFSRQLTP